MSRRLVMVQETSGLKSTIEAQSKSIGLEEVSNLADLMDRSYKGTIDYEGETLEQCAQEMRETIEGKYELFADRELHHFVSLEPPTLEEQEKRCARWAIGHSPDGGEIHFNWAARDKQLGKVIGHFQSGIKNQGEASIGYVVARDFQGKGLAQEAWHALFDFLHDVHSIKRVKAWSYSRNKASHRLAEQMGMNIVETIKDADFSKGASSDEFVFAKEFK